MRYIRGVIGITLIYLVAAVWYLLLAIAYVVLKPVELLTRPFLPRIDK